MDNKNQKNKIVYFPGLEQRLVEKGLEHLHQKQYDEAIDLLEHAIRLDARNSESHIGLLLAYFDAGLIDKAMDLADKMLQEGIGQDIEIMNIYIMYLVQLHKYEEVVAAIENLLAENRIPADKLEHFHRLLDFSLRMLDSSIDVHQQEPKENAWANRKIDFFLYQTPEEQMLLAGELNNKNTRPFVKDMTEYLQSEKGSVFFKTLLLNVLKEQEYDKPIEIQKFDKRITVIPEKLPHINESRQLKEILEILRQKLENEDPVLFAHIKALVERQFFLLYPFELESNNLNAWAAAYHVLGNEYFGKYDTEDELIEEYRVLQADLQQADSYIRMIEEISYPNL
ncbi:tetratricopeptide repeat protein [Bacillus tuaregi]|uniref:tetratricopeptide repeat protein n=1 Tax=Bacillus tuaregi TaxID=1816695 RepID=UPI0008F868B6|nr:tetratricopeptide repeat protein [Bacillus tuaregi]